jgi:NodT family efflux transporter outer membrane factor (OMF) lipoprotein
MRLRVWLGLSTTLALAGCDLAPNYQPPVVSLPSQFTDASGASGGVLEPSGDWWRNLHDRELDRLEDQVDAANPDLAAALADYESSMARADAALSGLYPEVDAASSLSTNKQSDDRPLRSKDQPTYYGNNQLYGGVVSYEVDIWGRVGDIVKATNADAEASRDALADARLELHATLARDYVDLRGLDSEAKLLADTIAIYRSALDLTRSRVEAKIAPPIDEQRAQTQLSTAEAQASDLALRRTALVDAIATLTGNAAAHYTLAAAASPMEFPRRPRVVPGDVLRRRPDVAAAEREAAAASAIIGVARASFYPKFTIGLLGGTQDTGLNLLSLTNSMYTVGPSVSAPLFDFGLREAQLKQAEARFKGASERYRSAVLRAVKEVQDNLSALRWLAEETRQTNAAATAARKASDMSMALYRDGAASYLDVVTAQNAALDAERSAIALRTRQLEGNIGLMLALGGGWSVDTDVAAAGIGEASR